MLQLSAYPNSNAIGNAYFYNFNLNKENYEDNDHQWAQS
jgi:hypothetical protein